MAHPNTYVCIYVVLETFYVEDLMRSLMLHKISTTTLIPVILVALERQSPLKDSRTPGVCGSPPEDATPIFISESGSSILGLSNDISFVSELFLEGG